MFNTRSKRRIKLFGLTEGMIVVDYACGSGQYALEYAKIVGKNGKIYAIDIDQNAINETQERIKAASINNIEVRLAHQYDSTLESSVADVVTALDVLAFIENPIDFLVELGRICKPNGFLVIDNDHLPRKKAKEIIMKSNIWEVIEESRDHMKCKKAV